MPKTLAPADIVFWAALVFLFGILAASLDWNVFLALCGAIACGVVVSVLLKCSGVCKTFVLIVFSFILGIFYFHFYFVLRAAWQNVPMNKKISFSAIIAEEPKVSEKYQSFIVSAEPPLQGDISILAPPFSNFRYGDLLRIEGFIEPPRSIIGLPTAGFPKISIIAVHKGLWLKEKLIDFKSSLLAQFSKNLPAEEAALLGGITLGSQAGFTKKFKNQMALSGTTHLVALSGYNISILVLAVAQVFGRFLSRRKTFYVSTVIIFLFVLMVGFGASVVRAAIMGFLALLAKEVGRLFNMRNAMALTAAGMVIVNPAVLAYDVGFQLSFASLLGIVYLSPALKRFFAMEDREDIPSLFETALMTLSAQLAVMPIVILVFGQFSLTAILTNVLILEFMPLTMLFGFLLAAAGVLGMGFAFLVARLAEILLAYEIGVIRFFADAAIPLAVPFADPFLAATIYYVALAAFIYRFSGPRPVV